ncbi:MAG: complex I NDUFA9 subunit family protein [Betaproteobacteria bacterium]
MKLKKILLIGGSGFVGTVIANRLSELGIDVTVPTRRSERGKGVLLLPNVRLVQADVHDPEILAGLMRGHDAIINLVGILHGGDFNKVHAALPKKIIAACEATGVRRLLHMSALKAATDAPSRYLATKGEGERAVLAAQGALDVTVFRPSVIFGAGDSFLCTFARLLKYLPLFPLGHGRARFQPVWVGDVAEAFIAAIANPATFGQAYDLCGPKVYTLRELVEYTAALSGHRTRILPLPDGLASLQATFMGLAPKPLLSPDNLRSLRVDSVCDATCKVFPGWQPRALEAVAPSYIADHAPRRRLDDYRLRAGR